MNNRTNSAGRTAVVGACAAVAAAAMLSSAAWADRGHGSVRAAARAEPARVEPARVEPARVGHVEPARGPVEVRRDVHVEQPPARVEVPARRDWDDHDEGLEHGGGFAPGGIVRAIRGQVIHDLPHHFPVVVNNVTYFCDDDGNYYQPQGANYVVIQPPVGGVVPSLPPGVVPVAIGPTTYYFLDGAFYVPQGNVFALVNPPPGIVVPELPTGATQIVVNGNVCYQFNGFNYLPSVQDGVTVYTVTPA